MLIAFIGAFYNIGSLKSSELIYEIDKSAVLRFIKWLPSSFVIDFFSHNIFSSVSSCLSVCWSSFLININICTKEVLSVAKV